MGGVTSLICSATFCLERVLTWTCCAFLLILLMMVICLLIIYGISVGYHYAQRELAAFAQWSRIPTTARYVGRDPMDTEFPLTTPTGEWVTPGELRARALVGENDSGLGQQTQLPDETYVTETPDSRRAFLENTESSRFELNMATSEADPMLTPNEKKLARRLIRRFRRSRNNTMPPFLRPLSSILTST